MIRKIFTSGFTIILLSVPLLVADSNAGGQNINTLPWEIIVEKFDAKEPFCTAKSKDGKTINFALSPRALTLTLPCDIKIPEEQTEAELNLSIWQQDQWADLPPLAVRIDPTGLTVDSNAIAEGFYNLLVVFDKNDIGKENKFHAVVAADWKKDLLAWCQKNKEQIETNPDSQLIHSSIAVSHIDSLMEMANKSSILPENVLSALSKAIKAKADFEDGNCPGLVNGLNKIRLKRFEGSSIEEFVIFIPKTYNKSKPEAVFLYPDNRRWAAGNNYASHSGLIDIWWHTVDNKNINWKNFEYFFNTLKQKLNIDENRVYVNGECGNGLAAMSLALNFPDKWAECSMSLGNTYRHMAGNALNLPLIFVRGGHNEDWAIGYYDFAVECFKYYGCRLFRHSKLLSTSEVRGGPVSTEIRDLSPYRVYYTIDSLANPSAYWVQIDGRKDENFIASIDAIAWGQSILVKTDNVDTYTLNLELAPIDCNRPVEIIENGQSLDFVTGQIFTKKSKKYINATYVKNERIRGPVCDVFTNPYLIVYGTGGKDKEFCEAIENVGKLLERKKQYFGEPESAKLTKYLGTVSHCLFFADTNMPEKLIDSHNLILVGTPESNLWLSKISKELPVQISAGGLIAHGEHYIGRDLGFILIYPNPMNPEKYVLVLSGTSSRAMANIPKAYRQMKLIRPSDVGIFEITEGADIRWYIMENFSSVWGWHDQWDQILALVNKKHPKWQWRQWIARAIRKQHDVDIALCEDPFRFSGLLPDRHITAEELEAEGVICEDPFRFSDLVSDGQITYRDLFNGFRNDWIVKIITDGRNLRELVGVPFDDISKRKVVKPTIDGLRYVELERDSKQTSLSVNELESDKKYTAALPYKLINGQRIGIVLKDYEIIGEGFLVPLLKSYLCKNGSLDLDGQLDSMRFNMF